MKEFKINNFYLVSNYFPSKLINKSENELEFNNLLSNKNFKASEDEIREIEIRNPHFEKIGFKADSLKGVYAKPLYVILENNLLNLTIEYYGYLLFHIDELDETQQKYNSVLSQIHKSYKENPELVKNSRLKYVEKFGSLRYLNELFDSLEKYNISIENKKEIALLI